MGETNFIDEIDCGNFFDHIDDLLDFPNDDVDNVCVGKGGGASIGYDEFAPLSSDNHGLDSELPGSESVFSGPNSSNASDLSAGLAVPYEDILQLEWLSNFMEDSFSNESAIIDKSLSTSSTNDSNNNNQFRTSSPVSVLESSSGSSNGKTLPISHEKRARSKRPRPPSFTPRPGIHLTSPTSSIPDTPEHIPCLNALSESNGFVDSSKKKKKIRILPPSASLANRNINESLNTLHGVRKCMHCEITKTPQWRAGPMGPKTLCNACGVRYKSGRLFPEYRPAASPTFVPTLHSNSHKKVVEMRTKIIEDKPEFIPKSDLLPPPPYM